MTETAPAGEATIESSAETALAPDIPPTGSAKQATKAAALLLALVALGDALTFGPPPGLGLFAYAVAVGIGVLLQWVRVRSRPRAGLEIAVALALAIPLVEAPDIAAMLLAPLGLVLLALASSGLLPESPTALPATLSQFFVLVPVRLAGDLIGGRGSHAASSHALGRALAVWVVPIGLALVFWVLFRSANPVIEDLFAGINPGGLLSLLDPSRIGFWLLLAVLVWPLLRPRLKRPRVSAPKTSPVKTAAVESLLFGAAAISRALLVFNLLFAAETGLDLVYLWGGAKLPYGMSYADYAHRGAYPLMVTALIAAAFVLAAMRRDGPGETSRPIRAMVYVFIVQNVFLCISAIYRLFLYVGTYSLTELRLAAGIWMLLVAIGLVLILLRIRFRRSNQWLVAMNLLALLLAVYVAALMDWPAVIASFNVAHNDELEGAGVALDLNYLEQLGPGVIPALDSYIAGISKDAAHPAPIRLTGAMARRANLAAAFRERAGDWRSWSFRDARLTAYLADNP